MSTPPENLFGQTPQDPSRTREAWVRVKDPAIRLALGIPEEGMPLAQFFGNMPQVQAAPTEPPKEPGFVTSVNRSLRTTGADYANYLQLAGELMNVPEFADYWSRKSQELKESAEKYPRAVPGIEDITDAKTGLMWATETFGEQVPVLASFLVPGMAGFRAAKALGAGAEAAKATALGAGFLSDLGMMTGESVGIAKERGEPITDFRVIGSGIGKAALDFIPFFAIAKKFGILKDFELKLLRHAFEDGYLKRAGKNAAIIMATEIPTEAMQEWINIELDNYFTGYSGPLTDDQKSQLYNAAAGAALFGALGFYAPRGAPPSGGMAEGDATQPGGAEQFFGQLRGQYPEIQKLLPSPAGTPPGAPPPDWVVPSRGEPRPPPTQTGAWQNVPTEDLPKWSLSFDFRNLYDPKTGALRTTAADYMRIVAEQMTFKYDPVSDTVVQPTSSSTYNVVIPGWSEKDGAWYLDASKDGKDPGKAQIVPDPTTGLFSGYDVYGNPLGVFNTLEQAQVAVQNTVYFRGKSYVFDSTGMWVKNSQDGHSTFVELIGTPLTPVEGAAVAIEQAKPQKAPKQTKESVGEAEVTSLANDAGMMRLLEARDEFLADADNYRSTDGQLKVAAAKRLALMEQRITKYAEDNKLVNPIQSTLQPVENVDVEEALTEKNQAEAKKATEPRYPNLNPLEAAHYDRLVEKEQFEGLSDREYDELSRLQDKVKTGTDRAGIYQPATTEELSEFTAEEQALLRKIDKSSKAKKKKKDLGWAYQAIKDLGIEIPQRVAPTPKREFKWIVEEGTSEGFYLNGEQVGGVSYEEVTDLGIVDYGREETFSPSGELKLVGTRDLTKPTFGWYANITEFNGYERFDGPFKTKREAQAVLEEHFGSEERLQMRDLSRMFPGWKPVAEKYKSPAVVINSARRAGVERGENGTFVATRVDKDGNVWDLGTFPSLEQAMAVAEGVSNPYADKMREAIASIWRTFNIRPKLYVLTTQEILDNTIGMPEPIRQDLLQSGGIFVSGRPGNVYLHLNAEHAPEVVIKNLLHEMIGHFGLRALLPTRHWDAVMRAYAVYNREKIAAVERRGASEAGRAMREAGDIDEANILSADEAIAYEAMDSFTGEVKEPYRVTFLESVVTTVRSWFRWLISHLPPKLQNRVFKYLPFTNADVRKLLRDTAIALREKNQPYVDTTRRGRVHIMAVKEREVMERSHESLTSVWLARSSGMFLQPLQHAERYNLPYVADYIRAVQRWWARKSSLQNEPVKLAERWSSDLNKAESKDLSDGLLKLTGISDELATAVSDPVKRKEALAEARENILRGLSPKAQEIFKQVEISMNQTLDRLERGLIAQMIRRYVSDMPVEEKARVTQELTEAYFNSRKSEESAKTFGDLLKKNLREWDIIAKLNAISAEMNSMRERFYFPYMRFGRYAVWVRAKSDTVFGGKKYKGYGKDKAGNEVRGQMIHFSTWETYRDQQEEIKALEKEFKNAGADVKIGAGWVSDQEFTMLGMPPALYEELKTGLDLNDEQKNMLKEIYYTKSPGQRFLANMVKRRGVRGFSQDALRVYAAYMMNAASHIARIEHGQDLDENVSNIRKSASGSGSTAAGIVAEYWQKHYHYLMNPENDWAGLRALGFMWYLGFNVKSAFVNLTQVPMVAYPYLSARFGDAASIAALQRGYKNAFTMAKGGALPGSPTLEQAINWGIEEGFLDESLATVLAGFSESSVLQRLVPESNAQRLINNANYYGSAMFRVVEKFNRFTTFLAARELALQKGMTEEQARVEAKEAVQSTMFEYAKWNRATYMRGPRSVFFLFWSYMQGLAYLMAGGKGKNTAMRTWVMMLLAAGLQGVPFAENVLDLLDWSRKELKELFGSEDPYTDTRLELRKFASTIVGNPDMLLHGWSKNYGLGPIHLLSLAGVPVPHVDTSGSMSAGRWLPGTDKLLGGERDPDKKFGQLMVDVLGPVAGIGYGLFSALNDNNPDTWKVWERAMPAAIKAGSQWMRRSERGAEEFRGGGAVAEFDPTNPEDRVSLVLNMIGFQPTKVGEAYEVLGSKERLRRYWTSRQAMVMENWAYAMRSKDPELIADAKEDMWKFNEEAPDPKLRLTPEKIRRSMKARARRIAQREAGLPYEKGFRRLYEEIDQIYGRQ